MSQSCETLVTKIKEWQKAILELEKLSDEFLNTSDDKLKVEIDKIKQEVKKLEGEYRELAYPELPDGEKLFWPEKEFVKEIAEIMEWNEKRIKVKNNHLVSIYLTLCNLSRFPPFNLSLFHYLEEFDAQNSDLRKFPRFSTSVKKIWINNNPNIEIPTDLTYLSNLEEFKIDRCGPKKFPLFSISVKKIWIDGTNIPKKEKQRIKKEYPNAEIYFT